MSHSWTHPWCKSPSRDEAFRAAEDNRPGPLPTLEEAIAAVTERRPVDAGGGGNVTGLRTELVTLEVTHRFADPIASVLLQALGSVLSGQGESVFVMDGSCEITKLTAERDAAIRERDELRSQVQILDEGQPTAPSDLGVWCTAKDLSARCKELAARLVTTAVRASSAETALREIFAQDYARSSVNGASWKMHDIAEKALKSAPAASGNVEKKPMKMPSREWFERMTSVDDSEVSAGGLACRVAELESAAKLAPAANASAESNHAAPAASGAEGTEPVAWMCEWTDHTSLYDSKTQAEIDSGGEIVPQPLYRSPPQAASGWLTAEDREWLTDLLENVFISFDADEWIRSLLARSSPPDVVAPASYAVEHPQPPRDLEWRKALAAAGVKVKEVGK